MKLNRNDVDSEDEKNVDEKMDNDKTMLDQRSILGRLNDTLIQLYEMLEGWKEDFSLLDCEEYKAMDDKVIDKMMQANKKNKKLGKMDKLGKIEVD